MQGKRRNVTIVEVAEMADVSIGTVSRHLNELPVRRPNRDRIEQAIAALGYRRNAQAAAMKTDKTHMIGLLVPGFDDFHARILEQLTKAIRRTKRALLTYCHGHDPETFGEALDFFAEQRVDALIIDGPRFTDLQIDDLTRQRIPIVLYNDVVKGVAADRVVVDNFKASYLAVRHLIDIGHRRIAILPGWESDSTARLRSEGFEAAMREQGLPIEPSYLCPGDWGPDQAYVSTKALFALSEPPTAIFASNYQIAVGALTWLKEQGLRVPDDLSLVSFDDVALFRLHEAGITAIAQPLARIAESIADLLVLRLTAPQDDAPRTVTLDCDLILRGSTRRPAAPKQTTTPSDRWRA
jgi:LacI family transcriptional regulator